MLACAALFGVSAAQAQSYTFSSLPGVYSPTGVAVDAAGNAYVTGYYGQAIFKVSPTGNVSTLAGNLAGSTDGVGLAARFNNPRAIAIDSAGILYVADTSNHTIRKITPTGEVSTLAGLAGARGWDDGTGNVARFDTPQGIAVDPSGNVYVADTGTRTVRKITPAGVVTTHAGLGYVTGSADGTGLAARFDTLQGITVDANGVVYVADTGNHTIRKITPAGVTTTLAGSAGNRGSLDGVGALARFDSPQALVVDATGTLFVSDTNNFTVRRVATDGTVTTLGGLAGVTGEASGVGAAARFYQVRGITVRPNGTLYLADTYNLKIGTPASQPAITVQPVGQSVAAGSSTILSVTATGAPPLAYQWQKDGVPIAGATRSTWPLASVQPATTGSYTVSVSNSVSTLISNSASIVVLSPLANDNFANAPAISGSTGSVTGLNNGATGEPGEPTHAVTAATASSVWYRWTAPATGTAIFENAGPIPMFIAAYTGSAVDTLTRAAPAGNWRYAFHATGGTTYAIALGSANRGEFGNFTLNWRMILNDNFEDAEAITGRAGTVIGNNNGATGQTGEPNHAVGSSAISTSVWYRWTPAETGLAALRALLGPTTPLVVAVYTGPSLTSLTRVTSATSGTTTYVPVAAGTTYYIAVGSTAYTAGPFAFDWSTIGQPVIISQSGGGSYTAGSSATFTVRDISHLPVTYQWFKNDVPIAGASNATFALTNLQPSDGATYSVRVSNALGTATSTGFAPLVILLPPPNDNFAAAQPVFGLNGSITGTNVNATGEPGEPAHWNNSGTGSSVWYRWTAPTGGLAVIDTVGSTFDTVLAVYTGDTLASLVRVVQDDDRGGGRTSQVSFAAISGTTYWIAVGGNFLSARGALTLGWQLSPTLAIAAAPISQTIGIGGSATFTVQATGPGITYQWNRNGTAIPGATAPSLTVADVQSGSDASYTVTISNSSGSLTSAPATLAVTAPALTSLTVRHASAGGGLLWSIAGGNGTLVAVGNAGVILSSTDNGRTWTPRNSGVSVWIVGVTYGDGQFVAVADRGIILTSTDGANWTLAPSTGTTQRMNNVVHADGKFVAVGEAGTILTSADARTWTPRISGVTAWLHGLAYNERIGHFAASGQGGVILYSPDGITWNQLPVSGLTVDVEALTAVSSYADFVGIGHNGTSVSVHRDRLVLKTGESIITWSGEMNRTGTTADFVGLAAGASALFATGQGGKVITAVDDRGPWTALPSGVSGILLGGLFYNDSLFIVGENETILQSAPLYSSRLINISTRGQVGTGANVMISGFVITGDTPKQVLVRAAGPTLASAFGLSGTLAAPVLTLVDNQNRTVATNAGWSSNANAPAIVSTAARVGAFPFAAASADSAVLTTLAPGAYTALISGTNNTTGLSIVEVYDADTLSNQGSRAINISTRGIAGSGQNKMIAGFVIDGASSRRVLIRAVGPTLGNAPFSIGGTLAEPQLELYNSRNLPHASAGAWGLQPNADEIRSSAKTVGAFDLPDGSKDAAMVVTLMPGAWTVQVGTAGSTSGVVLVEVYALP